MLYGWILKLAVCSSVACTIVPNLDYDPLELAAREI